MLYYSPHTNLAEDTIVDVAVLELLIRLEYKRHALRRRLLGISGISGDSYPIFMFFAVIWGTFTVAPLSLFTSPGGPALLTAETAFLVMALALGIFFIWTVILAPIGILIW